MVRIVNVDRHCRKKYRNRHPQVMFIFLQCIESRQKVQCYIYAIYGTAPKIRCKVHVVRCHCSISIDLGKWFSKGNEFIAYLLILTLNEIVYLKVIEKKHIKDSIFQTMLIKKQNSNNVYIWILPLGYLIIVCCSFPGKLPSSNWSDSICDID